MANFLGNLVKWLFYAALLGLGGYLLWRYREAVRAAIIKFLDELRAWWRQWFGGDGPETEGTAADQQALVASRPFTDFVNPYAAAAGQGWTAARLVRHTFEALEAWAREQGCPREADQTPHEFVRALATRYPRVGRPAERLADLYARVAYATGGIRPDALAPLRELWSEMQASGMQTSVPVEGGAST